MKILFIGIAGLNTSSEGDMLGMKAFLWKEADLRRGGASVFLQYDDPNLLEKVETAAKGYDIVIIVGHSFGGAAAVWLSERVSFAVLLTVLLDPAPNIDRFHQFYPWQIADILSTARWTLGKAANKAICFYQHNMQIGGIGVCGVPIVERPGSQRNIDVTPWGLVHNDMVSDPRVLAVISYAFTQLVPIV